MRVDVPNARGTLRFGMFVQVVFLTGSDQRRTLVPRAAVQAIGERNVLDHVATEGSFLLRAEAAPHAVEQLTLQDGDSQ